MFKKSLIFALGFTVFFAGHLSVVSARKPPADDGLVSITHSSVPGERVPPAQDRRLHFTSSGLGAARSHIPSAELFRFLHRDNSRSYGVSRAV